MRARHLFCITCVFGLIGGAGCVTHLKTETPVGVDHRPYHAKPAYMVLGPMGARALEADPSSPQSSPLHVTAPAEAPPEAPPDEPPPRVNDERP